MSEYAISHWPDTTEINKKLDALVDQPMWQIRPDRMETYLKQYEEKCARSAALVEEARNHIPGAVQHNTAFNYPFPLVINKSGGAYLWDADENRYMDYTASGGAVLLGHGYQKINEKVIELLQECGPATAMFHEYELKLAKLVKKHMPWVEMIRMLGSGTEAVMGALRAARSYTGKAKVIKFGGDYHGWSDQLVYGLRVPGTGTMEAVGIPDEVFTHTQEVFPNDIEKLREQLVENEKHGGTAAIILEPLGCESATRPVLKDYNRQVRELCDEFGTLLIFDEVVTGFRVGLAGAQGYFDVHPDLTIFGKILTGGYPAAGGVGGRREIVSLFAAGFDGKPKAYVGGTLAANPMSCVAGYYAIKEMEETDVIQRAGRAGDRLCRGMQKLIDKYELPFVAYNFASICHLHTSAVMQSDITNPKQLLQVDARKKMMQEMSAALTVEGITSIASYRYYTTAAHTDEIIDETLEGIDRVLATMEPA